MTLDEAIKHWEEKTEALYKAIPCDGCAFNECVKEHKQLAEWLKELKQLRKQTRWIPVGEEMPAADEDVLVTNGRGIHVGWFDSVAKCWLGDFASEYFMNHIIAWMPLPQHYKAESEKSWDKESDNE